MRWRTEEAGKEIERLLGVDPPLHREAWYRMKGWYKAAVDRAPPPLGYLKADNSGARGPISPSNTHGGEHNHICLSRYKWRNQYLQSKI